MYMYKCSQLKAQAKNRIHPFYVCSPLPSDLPLYTPPHPHPTLLFFKTGSLQPPPLRADLHINYMSPPLWLTI